MAIKVKAKDEDTLVKELEEWSIGVNLFDTSSSSTTVKINTSDMKKDNTKRNTYANKEITQSDL